MKFDIFRGDYIFHFHTRHTDGRSEIEDYFECATTNDVPHLIFLEHIRRAPSYDVEDYARRVDAAAARYALRASLGFEAKLLPDGTLDISPENAERASVLGLAEHGFPADAELLVAAFRQAVEHYRKTFPEKEIVWVHPGLWLRRHRRLEELDAVYREMLAHAQEHGVRIERNARHRLIREDSLDAVAPDHLVHGLDAHSVEEMSLALRRRSPAEGSGCD